MITGALPLKVSATSWAWLNDVGMTTWGFAVTGIGSGRTTAPRPRRPAPPRGVTAPTPVSVDAVGAERDGRCRRRARRRRPARRGRAAAAALGLARPAAAPAALLARRCRLVVVVIVGVVLVVAEPR